MVEHLPSSNEAMGSVPIIDKNDKVGKFLNEITVASCICDDVYFKINIVNQCI